MIGFFIALQYLLSIKIILNIRVKIANSGNLSASTGNINHQLIFYDHPPVNNHKKSNHKRS